MKGAWNPSYLLINDWKINSHSDIKNIEQKSKDTLPYWKEKLHINLKPIMFCINSPSLYS